jgi:hypothetical protein
MCVMSTEQDSGEETQVPRSAPGHLSSNLAFHFIACAAPGDVGQDCPRLVEIDGDRVTLTVLQYPLNGEPVVLRLQWQRVR